MLPDVSFLASYIILIQALQDYSLDANKDIHSLTASRREGPVA